MEVNMPFNKRGCAKMQMLELQPAVSMCCWSFKLKTINQACQLLLCKGFGLTISERNLFHMHKHYFNLQYREDALALNSNVVAHTAGYVLTTHTELAPNPLSKSCPWFCMVMIKTEAGTAQCLICSMLYCVLNICGYYMCPGFCATQHNPASQYIFSYRLFLCRCYFRGSRFELCRHDNGFKNDKCHTNEFRCSS